MIIICGSEVTQVILIDGLQPHFSATKTAKTESSVVIPDEIEKKQSQSATDPFPTSPKLCFAVWPHVSMRSEGWPDHTVRGLESDRLGWDRGTFDSRELLGHHCQFQLSLHKR